MDINRLTDTRYGKMLYNRYDIYIGRSLEIYGEWSQLEMDFMKSYIPLGGVCVDVGANIGTHTLFFCNAVGPEGCVVAFEPQHIIFQLLCANVALNNHLNVRTHNLAVSDSSGLAKMRASDYTRAENFGSNRLIEDGSGSDVQTKALDDCYFERLDLVKIDVEGWEPQVILGAVQTIRRHQPYIYAEYHPKEHSQDLVKLIKSLDYDVYQHFAPSYNPNNYKKVSQDIFRNNIETNIFCVPSGRSLTVDLPKL